MANLGHKDQQAAGVVWSPLVGVITGEEALAPELSASDLETTTSAPEPGTSTQEPGSSTPEPGTSTQEPGTSTPEQGTSTQEPGTSTSVPGTSTSVPGTSTSVPGTSTPEPGTSTPEPGTSIPEPGTSTLEPGTSTPGPGTSTPGPAPEMDAPELYAAALGPDIAAPELLGCEDDSDGIPLCRECRYLRRLSPNYFPEYLLERTCQAQTCLANEGKCVQQYMVVQVRVHNYAQDEMYREDHVKVGTGCRCLLNKGSVFEMFIGK
ncbi:uncharacterized protein LOC144887898 [Branchiostoma floridae x Branchiostoma japonicum]